MFAHARINNICINIHLSTTPISFTLARDYQVTLRCFVKVATLVTCDRLWENMGHIGQTEVTSDGPSVATGPGARGGNLTVSMRGGRSPGCSSARCYLSRLPFAGATDV